MGRHQWIGDLGAIRGAAAHTGAGEFLAKLPEGYETVLGPEFQGARSCRSASGMCCTAGGWSGRAATTS
jgi:hypothetical protein